MIDAKQMDAVGQRLQGMQKELVLNMDPGDDPQDPFSRSLCEVMEDFAEASAGRLKVHREVSPFYPSRPSLHFKNIQYLAIPAGQELGPFLDLLLTLSSDPAPLDQSLPAASLEVLMAATCPNCAKVVEVCTTVAAVRPQIRLSIIDVQHYSDLAGTARSVPMVVVDGGYTFVGPLQEEQLLKILASKDSPDHIRAVLGSMVAAGRIQEAAPLLLKEPGLRALAQLMQLGGLQDRMGLMLLAETVLEGDPHCLDRALPFLLPLLEGEDTSLRGDVADLLGQIGAPGACQALTLLLEDENPDVRELAEEALDSLRRPS